MHLPEQFASRIVIRGNPAMGRWRTWDNMEVRPRNVG
jgi:hypothetical protein